MTDRIAIILAAGMGTRMKSSTPKVLHEVGGRPMVEWVLSAARNAGCDRSVLVVGTHSDTLRSRAGELVGEENVVIQDPPLGTGHAVNVTRDALERVSGTAVVLFADNPLLPPTVISEALETVDQTGGISVVGFEAEDPGAYGRLVISADGKLERIVEAKDATEDELAIRLCNSGVMAAPIDKLFSLLADVTNENAKGEYYLTDIVGLARAAGLPLDVITCDEADVLGVNSRVQLAEAEKAFQMRARRVAMESGVTLIDPDSVFFSFDTEIGPDTVIEPNVVIGKGVRIGSDVSIKASSHLEGCTISDGASIGPFARIRPGSQIDEDVKIGNFVEVKNVHMEAGAKASHLSYLGDGHVGADANIGAGTIFCNYDGFFKYRTEIGKGAFIGSNSALVAPVKIGDGAYVGSGSVVTKDVPSDALTVGRARQRDIDGWALTFRTTMSDKKAKTKG